MVGRHQLGGSQQALRPRQEIVLPNHAQKGRHQAALLHGKPCIYCCCGVFTVVLPLAVSPFGPVPVPETVVVPFPLFVDETVPPADLPRGPVTDPAAVVVVPLLLTVPLAVLVPPFGPTTVAAPLVPVTVFFTVAVPVAELPRAPVALPVAVKVFPLRVTELLAEPPRGPRTECCANPTDTPNDSASIKAAVRVFLMVNLLVCQSLWRIQRCCLQGGCFCSMKPHVTPPVAAADTS
jgi:hypothetical protein